MSQTTMTPATDSPAPKPPPPQSPGFWRSLARGFLGLWWVFVVALAAGVASYLGNHAGPLVSPIIPQVVAWARALTLPAQVGLAILILALLALMGWLTYLAWQHRQRQAAEEVEANVAQQAAAFTQTMEHDVNPRLDNIGATVDETSRDVKTLIQEGQSAPLPLVRDLDRVSFRMGDRAAANFRYVYGPVRAIFDQATATLHDAAQYIGAKQGILVTGAANAGKTRLGLEALIAALPDWDTLVWNVGDGESRIPSAKQLEGRSVAVFLDDIQNYAAGGDIASGSDGRSAQSSVAGPGATLRTLYQRVCQDSAHVVIVATCRHENQKAAEGSLGWFFQKLDEVAIPTFNRDEGSLEARDIIAEFAEQGAIRDEWNGTLGSLVLGLGRKRQQYRDLVIQHNPDNPAVPVLRAMKLLTIGGVRALTGRSVCAVCDQILHRSALAVSGEAWDDALEELKRLEFSTAITPTDDGDMLLAILKNDYFKYVVDDYPEDYQLQQHRAGLFSCAGIAQRRRCPVPSGQRLLL